MIGQQVVQFRVAADASEFEQVFRLGYDTFCEEIPQHPPNGERRHVDRFHRENTYVIALDGDEVVGMVAIRGQRPFSLDEKLGAVDSYLPPDRNVCELRLLAVRPEYRRGLVFKGLIDHVVDHGRAQGFDLAIISGTLRQQKLYRHLGFIPFGPVVGTEAAPFQPMYLPVERLEETSPAMRAPREEPVNFLPGPVALSPEVRRAFARLPVSHRNEQFRDDFSQTKARLCELVNAAQVEVLLGTGTLANDVIGGQISLLDAPGVVLSNGEFGERLIDQARRLQIAHTPVEFGWGERFDLARVERVMHETGASWIWAVQSETSTGMLNDLAALKALAAKHGAKLSLDCVSAVGAVPIDLDGVYLASGASGKALAAFPGLSFVYYAHELSPAPTRLPRYLDLGYYADKQGIPFTHSSNLVAALTEALQRFESPAPFQQIVNLSRWIRPRLRELGLKILVPEEFSSPAVVTLVMNDELSAITVGDRLFQQGFLVAYQSEYLLKRNWLQISWMGHCRRSDLERVTGALGTILGHWAKVGQVS